MEKAKPVLDIIYKPYMSYNKDQDNNNQPQYFQTTDGQKVLKKVVVFYSQVPIPYVMKELNELLSTTKKPKYHIFVNVNIYALLILPLLGSFEGKSLAFAFSLQNELIPKDDNSSVCLPCPVQLTCPNHACDK
ncbi:hypothetical protein DSO57_1021836 [Entomophthora muscae]|uniref:Uncharacterized protein n=1 Tax=Entomophthora muscae TaxID=34485 RepID=A0ACC2UNV1_9FUNG|nr:hypothetical protein DSO57_1021836 [Entomophthora muscae]